MARRAFLILLPIALAAGLTALAHRARQAALPDLGKLPPFSLTDHEGRPLSRESLFGRPFVADFIFTRCPTVCPAMTSRMAQLQRRLPQDVALVSYSVDPEHDTVPVLAEYARAYDAEPRWRFVTGPRRALHALATDGFHLAALEIPADERRPGDDGPFLHSTKFVLLDGRGTIRGFYDSADGEDLQRLVADAQRLSRGAP